MNLNYKFPPIFWATARLMAESGALDYLEEDLDIFYQEEGDEEAIAAGNVRYFEMSAALNRVKEFGTNIELPDINTSSYTFRPDVPTNTIYFGLRGISRIGIGIIEEIMANRPYTSLDDFLNRVKTNKIQASMLIKAGAFDSFLEPNQTREDLLYYYCAKVADTKSKLNLQNFAHIINLGLVPEELDFHAKLHRYNRHIRKFFLFGNRIVITEPHIKDMLNFFEFSDFDYEDGVDYINEAKWKRFYDAHMDAPRQWIKQEQKSLLEAVNQAAIQEMLDKYNKGNISYNEMESLSYYHHQHELDYPEYDEWLSSLNVKDFFDLPELPQVEATYKSGATVMKLDRIVGTCIGRDKSKQIVGFLTPTGFLKIKVYRSQFVKYDKQIRLDGQTEKSWFSKGSKLLLSGYRNEDHFILKTYRNHPHGKAIYQIMEPGVLKSERLGEGT